MKAIVLNEQEDLSIDKHQVEPIVRFVLEQEACSTDELSIYFVSEEKICQLHDRFFNDPSPTDCISFPMDGGRRVNGYHILGELFICPKVAIDYLAETPEITHNCYTELTLYLVHGVLHLLGYQDKQKEEQEKMYATQTRYFNELVRKRLLLIAD